MILSRYLQNIPIMNQKHKAIVLFNSASIYKLNKMKNLISELNPIQVASLSDRNFIHLWKDRNHESN